jgi:hypothetical protein
MKIKLANTFLIFGVLLYIGAGIAVISKMNYSVLILIVAIIFLAFGFFVHIKQRWIKLFKKKI